MRLIYKENDSEFINLIREKESKKKLLKTYLIDFLSAKRESKAIYDASLRPKGVILKYKAITNRSI